VNDDVDQKLVLQRVRNRRIDALDLAASISGQLEYQKKVPLVNVPNEVIHQWEDWLNNGDRLDLNDPAYTAAEMEALVGYHAVWLEVCKATPSWLPPLEDLVSDQNWLKLSKAAQHALNIMMIRGPLPDDKLMEH
jgi:hypothetical protein